MKCECGRQIKEGEVYCQSCGKWTKEHGKIIKEFERVGEANFGSKGI